MKDRYFPVHHSGIATDVEGAYSGVERYQQKHTSLLRRILRREEASKFPLFEVQRFGNGIYWRVAEKKEMRAK